MPFLPGTQIEIVGRELCRGLRCDAIRSVLFDFDGTLSLIRQGWQDVMVPMMVDLLAELGSGETRPALAEVVTKFVDRLTGKQTIYQMIALCEQIERRGGQPLEPLAYKHMYLEELWTRIEGRVTGLKNGTLDAQDLVVPGAYQVLENLKRRGLACYLASGTDQPYVRDEAAALGLMPYFTHDGETHVYGALDQYERFSKAQVIQDILRRHDLRGEQLLAFGDGFVEIEETKAVGGIAVGVASDEERRRGINAWKRARLIRAGADAILPDFREGDILLAYLLDRDARVPVA